MELKTLKIFTTEVEAFMAKNLLLSYDIESYIINNITSTNFPIFNNTIGGPELKVDEKDFEKALEIIKNNG